MTESFGKYTLVRHLAEGGMATIWVAEQKGPEGFARELVIKRLLPKLAKDRVLTEMFLDEARLASQLAHPNIGQIYELGTLDGDYFIAMEFVDGISLEGIIDAYGTHGAMHPDLAARLMVDVLQALDYAHKATDKDGSPLGIVHRDVTPSNILVSSDGIVKLVDFGVAKAVKHSGKTQTGAVKGKYAYMSPEQIKDQDVGPASDVFAAGITFYEVLTGQKPFGEELPAVSRILREEAVDPREIDPRIPELYAQIAMKALEKGLDDRYGNANTMRMDLETALRMRNSYVGPRELSALVRTLCGLPLLDSSEDVSSGLFSADMTAENLSIVGGDVAEDGSTPRKKRPTAMIVAAGGVIVLVFVVLAFVVMSRPNIPRGTMIVLSEEVPVEPGAQPEALFVRDGELVVIETIPEAALFHRSIFIGTTPIQTRLSAGAYKIELVRDGVFKRDVVKVVEGDAFTRHRVVLADLKEGNGKAPKKPAPKKPKILENLGDLLE